MKKLKNEPLALALLLALVAALSIFWAGQKSGYFVDEGMTLYLANGNYTGAVTSRPEGTIQDFLKEYVLRDSLPATAANLVEMLKQLAGAGNYSQQGSVAWYDAARALLQGRRVWMDGSELFGQLTVPPGEGFDYLQVYMNQAVDVHPPLYYLLVHTVFSLGGGYSDWYLFGINLFFLLLTCLFLYKAGRLITGEPTLPMLAVAIYGFSQGFISTAVYFRMYAILTFWVTLTYYLHLRLEESGWRPTRRLTAALVATVALGFYTHYYYVVFLFPLFLLTAAKMLRGGHKKELGGYFFRLLAGGVVSLCVWPLSVYHILFGYRGTEAAGNLFSAELFSRLGAYYGILLDAFFFGSPLLFWALVAMGLFLLGFSLKLRGPGGTAGSRLVQILPVVGFYMLVVIQISPALEDRYLMPVYPLISLVMAAVLLKPLWLTRRTLRHRWMAPVLIASAMALGGLLLAKPNYLYLENRSLALGTTLDPAGMNCLMVADDDWRGFPEALRLSRFGQVMVVGEAEMDALSAEKPARPEEPLLVYLYEGLPQQATLAEVEASLALSGPGEEIASDIQGFNAYLFHVELYP